MFADRLQSAEGELEEMEGGVREEESSYSQDRATLNALQKNIDKLEVCHCDVCGCVGVWVCHCDVCGCVGVWV